MEQAGQLAARNPKTRLVIDHLGIRQPFEPPPPAQPWAGALVGPEEMTGDQMVAAMAAVGVDGAVLVSPFSMYRYDPSYVLEVEA